MNQSFAGRLDRAMSFTTRIATSATPGDLGLRPTFPLTAPHLPPPAPGERLELIAPTFGVIAPSLAPAPRLRAMFAIAGVAGAVSRVSASCFIAPSRCIAGAVDTWGAARPPGRDRANVTFAGGGTGRGDAGGETNSTGGFESTSRVIVLVRVNATGDAGAGVDAGTLDAGVSLGLPASTAFGRRRSSLTSDADGRAGFFDESGTDPTVAFLSGSIVVAVACFVVRTSDATGEDGDTAGVTFVGDGTGVLLTDDAIGSGLRVVSFPFVCAGVGLGGLAADLSVSTSSFKPPISASYLASNALTFPRSRVSVVACVDARRARSSSAPTRFASAAASVLSFSFNSRRISRILVTVCTCAYSSISITSVSSFVVVSFDAPALSELTNLGDPPGLGRDECETFASALFAGGVTTRGVTGLVRVIEWTPRVDGGGAGSAAGVPGLN